MKKSEALSILGLQDGFTEDELKKAHRKLVVQNHPDRFQDPAEKARAEERTKRINEANDVLKSGKWEPEFGPTVNGYGSSPYGGPRTTASGPGWVEVEIDPEMFRRWAQAAAAAQQQQQAAGQGTQQQGYNPFGAPFSPFAQPFTPPTAEQRAARAQQDLRIGLGMLAVKVVLCGLLLLHGNFYDAALTWSVITYLLLLAGRFGGCRWVAILLFIPIVYPTAGMLENAAQQGGVISALIIGALFLSALYYDFRDLHDAYKRYRAMKANAGE